MSITYPKLNQAIAKADSKKNAYNRKISFAAEAKSETVGRLITSRIDEVKSMTTRKDLYEMSIDKFSDQLKKYITSLIQISSIEYRAKVRKEKQKEKRFFRYISRTILLLIKSFITRRKYFLEKWLTGFNNDPTLSHKEVEAFRAASIKQVHETKSALTLDALMSLEASPEQRKDEGIKIITWLLSRFNGFDNIIPLDNVKELARRVKYQKVENGRILAHEGAKSQRVFYIISGKICMVKRFQLSDGDLFKNVGFMNKGEITNPVEIEKNMLRSHTLFSKGVSEVFYLDSNDLKVLRYYHYHLPLDFLTSLDLFRTYPFQTLLKRNESLVYKYYGPKKVISTDAENSEWIFVVKSGSAKVVKKIQLVNRNANSISQHKHSNNNEDMFKSNSESRFPKINLYRPRNLTPVSCITECQKQIEDLKLDPEQTDKLWNSIEFSKRSSRGVKLTHSYLPLRQTRAYQREARIPTLKMIDNQLMAAATPRGGRNSIAYLKPKNSDDLKQQTPRIKQKQQEQQQEPNSDRLLLLESSSNFAEKTMSATMAMATSEKTFFLTHDKYSSRSETTFNDESSSSIAANNENENEYDHENHDKNHEDHDDEMSYVALSVIKKGDIIGLHCLDEKFTNDKEAEFLNMYRRKKSKSNRNEKKLLLLSDGCELVLLNKNHFMTYADVDTLCKIEQLEDPANRYMTDENVRDYLSNKKKWEAFKKTIFASILNQIQINKNFK